MRHIHRSMLVLCLSFLCITGVQPEFVFASRSLGHVANSHYSVSQQTIANDVTITSVVLSHQDYPNPNTWVNTSQTVDGNAVRVQVTVQNTGTAAYNFDLTIQESSSGTILATQFDKPEQINAQSTTVFEFVWDTLGYAWGANDTAQSNRVVLAELSFESALVDSASANVLVKPRPAILVPGWLSSPDDTAESGQWRAYTGATGYLRGAHSEWEDVYVSGMDVGSLTRLGNSPLKNAEGAFATTIDNAREQHNAWHVDILAYSLGGLISRAYLHYEMPNVPTNGRPAVFQLIMLATPNIGSPCAPLVSNTRYLSPEYGWYFNQIVTDTNGTRTMNLIGTPGESTCRLAFNPIDYNANVCGQVYALTDLRGRGDNVVSRASAFSVAADREQETTTFHTGAVIPFIQGAKSEDEVIITAESDFTSYILPQLALDPTDIANLPTVQGAGVAPGYSRITDPNVLITQAVDQRSLTVAAGETVVINSRVPGSAAGAGVIVAAAAPISFEVRSASGTTNGTYEAGGYFHTAEIANAPGSDITISITNDAPIEQTMSVSVVVDVPFSQRVRSSEVSAQADIGPDDILCYDVNLDGLVTPTDVVYVLNRVGQTDATIDYDGSGTVDEADVNLMRGSIGLRTLEQ